VLILLLNQHHSYILLVATNVKVLTEVMIAETIPSNEVFGFKNPRVFFSD